MLELRGSTLGGGLPSSASIALLLLVMIRAAPTTATAAGSASSRPRPRPCPAAHARARDRDPVATTPPTPPPVMVLKACSAKVSRFLCCCSVRVTLTFHSHDRLTRTKLNRKSCSSCHTFLAQLACLVRCGAAIPVAALTLQLCAIRSRCRPPQLLRLLRRQLRDLSH